MLTAILLFAIGAADLCRSRALNGGRRASTSSAVAIVVIWLALAVLALAGLGVSFWLVALSIAAAALWLAFTTSAEHEVGRGGRTAIVGLVIALALFVIFDRTALGLAGFVVDWHDQAPSTVLRQTPLVTLALGSGLILFLCESANILVRTALHTRSGDRMRAPVPAAPGPDVAAVPARAGAARRPWWRWGPAKSRREVVTDHADLMRADLKGGRLIGPLERLLIVGMVLAGFYPIVAALVAAKGIVRFPEIANDAGSGDGLSGTKAEYFLVGSLVSWAVAGGAVALIALSVRG